MNDLLLASTLILMACFAWLVVANRKSAKVIRQYVRDKTTLLKINRDLDAEIDYINYNPIVGDRLLSSSRWKIKVVGRQFDYIVTAQWEKRWNENSRRIPLITIKKFHYDPSDVDAKEYAKNCAEELADKLNEDCEI